MLQTPSSIEKEIIDYNNHQSSILGIRYSSRNIDQEIIDYANSLVEPGTRCCGQVSYLSESGRYTMGQCGEKVPYPNGQYSGFLCKMHEHYYNSSFSSEPNIIVPTVAYLMIKKKVELSALRISSPDRVFSRNIDVSLEAYIGNAYGDICIDIRYMRNNGTGITTISKEDLDLNETVSVEYSFEGKRITNCFVIGSNIDKLFALDHIIRDYRSREDIKPETITLLTTIHDHIMDTLVAFMKSRK